MNYDYSFRSWKGKEADYCLESLKGVAALPTLVSEQWNIFGTSDFHDEKTFFFSCWVAQSCPTLCDYMEWSMPGFPVLYHLPELTQTHVQWVSDAIQPSRLCHPLLPLPSIFPSSGSFLMSWLFTSGSQSLGASPSAPVLPVNIQKCFPLGLTGLISFQPKGLSRVFSNTTAQKHQFFGAQPSSQSNSHIHTRPQENHSLD